MKQNKIVKFSVDKHSKEINEYRKWSKKHPYLAKFKDFYDYIRYRLIDNICNFFKYEIKYFIQRGKKGWSNGDWWRFDYYVSDIIIGCLQKLKKEGHGLPTWTKNKTEKQAKNEWKYILNTIIKTFKIAKKVSNGDLIYFSNERLRKNWKTIKGLKAMSKKECTEYREGWKLFEKWFFHLWD